MKSAYPMQKIQDWLTQQWVIICGRKIDPTQFSWLIGPFGNPCLIGDNFINELAAKENLIIVREEITTGLIPTINSLNLSEIERSTLSAQVIDFYENTSRYTLHFKVKWNPLFKFFGVLISRLFSHRLRQLNIPTTNSKSFDELNSELISLADPVNNVVKYTFWLRSIKSSGQPVYSGIYGISTLPSGKTCIKAVFPLPNGNATVLMTPAVGENGEMVLESSGKKFGDAGFYFLLKDAKGNFRAKYVRSFHDRLMVRCNNGSLSAQQVLTLWKMEVMRFYYKMDQKH